MSDFVSREPSCTGELPERFVRFCRLSIENRSSDVLYTEPNLSQLDSNYDDVEGSALEFEYVKDNEVIPLVPLPSERPVAAIDTSTIRLGELDGGSLCALRGAVVTLERKRYKYTRYGPLIFSLGTSSRIDQELGITSFAGVSNVEILLRRVRNSLEKWIQLSVTRSLSNALILLDGSLIAGTIDNSANDMQGLLKSARRSDNLVIGISKNTQLRIRDRSITSLLEQDAKPCLLDVDKTIRCQFPAYQIQFMGQVFVGKLAEVGFPFRIDVDRQVSIADRILGIEQLAGTDIVDQGYPETLRLAHVLSTFSASDVLAIQSMAAVRFGIQILPKFALRRSLFGPFGTRWETMH